MLHTDSVLKPKSITDKQELSSFPFISMFVPTDMYNFSTWLISVNEIEQNKTVADVT